MIAEQIEKLLLSFKHPEMPTEKPDFKLHVNGKEDWSWADIEPNWKIEDAEQPVLVTMRFGCSILGEGSFECATCTRQPCLVPLMKHNVLRSKMVG